MSTIIQQGSFISTGLTTTIPVRSDIDIFETHNFTQISTQQTPGRSVKTFWQKGMASGTGISWGKDAGLDTIGMINLTVSGYTLVDTSSQQLATPLALTAISNAVPPVVTTGSTATLSDNDVVRIYNVIGAQQLGGYDFSIDVLTGTTFELSYMGGILAGTTGNFTKVLTDPIFYPSYRYITGLTLGTSTTVAMSVSHNYTVGQKVRFKIPSGFGTTQLDGLSGTITSSTVDLPTNFNIIVVDIDSSGFTPFFFPLTGAVPFSPAIVTPVGEAAEEPYSNLLGDATENRSLIGMKMAGGINGPAGSVGDVIYWKAIKSFNG